MKKLCGSIIFLFLTLFITGCLNLNQEFTINSDGSGKLRYVSKMKSDFTLNSDTETPEDKAKASVKRILEKSEGIAAWKDVSYKVLDSGKILFSGTAYFKDFKKLKIDSSVSSDIKPVFEKRDDGTIRLALVSSKEAKGDEGLADELSEAEINKRLIAEKAKFKQSLLMMNMFLPEFKTTMTFNLPGKVRKAVNFSKVPDNEKSVTITYDGKKLLKVLTDIGEDDNFWREAAAYGISYQKSGPPFIELNARMFGFRSVPEAIADADDQMLFNYKREVKEAQAGYAKMLTSLGFGSSVALPAAEGDGFQELYVAGVRYVGRVDEKNNLRPFNWPEGYTLSVIGRFKGSVTAAKEGTVFTALTDNGEDLLPEKKWNRSLGFPRLSEDRANVIFEVKLKKPSLQAKYLKEVSGSLKYTTSGGTEKIDLGTLACRAGSKVEKFKTSIEETGPASWPKGANQMKLKLFLKSDEIKDIKFYDTDGLEIKFKRQGYSYSGRSSTFNYVLKDKLPEKLKIVVEKHAMLKNFEIPFKLENINLLGKPIK
ncbi:MAG: hypothetical protein ACYTFY_07705 [Planctomycetota bacterium]|jgi:hypothetical protein